MEKPENPFFSDTLIVKPENTLLHTFFEDSRINVLKTIDLSRAAQLELI